MRARSHGHGVTAPVLAVEGLTVSFGAGTPTTVLRDVDLRIERGEIVALVGESGSGKSTLALAVQGLLPADASPRVQGLIRVDGRPVVGASARELRQLRRKAVGAIFQDPLASLNPSMRIGQQLREAGDDRDPLALLQMVGIPDPEGKLRAYPHQLSGGQQQRVMIAMALACDPVLIVADEPTTALDVTVQAHILDTIAELRDRTGAALLFVTHDLAVAASIADRICVLYAGRMVEDGALRAVLRRPAHPYTAALLAARFGLDVDRNRVLPGLQGEPPVPGKLPAGCAFAPRCAHARLVCRAAVPLLAPVPQHDGVAACVRAAELSGTVVVPSSADLARRPAGTAAPVIEVAGVTKRFGTRPRWSRREQGTAALAGADLQVGVGETVALVGESGSGKSTLLRVLAGLVEPDAGAVTRSSALRPQMVYQDATLSLTPWLSVEQLVGERLRVRGVAANERRRRVLETLDLVGLSAHHLKVRPSRLSGGQRQRVAIARAVVDPPELLLCDEPVSALDVSLAALILNLLVELQRRLGMAMVFVTHDLSVARYVADRIVVLQAGRVVEEGEADAVVRAPSHPYTRALLASMPVAAVGG